VFKIIDYGASIVLDIGKVGEIVARGGTPSYWSPELILGKSIAPLTIRYPFLTFYSCPDQLASLSSDILAAGCCIREILLDEPLFQYRMESSVSADGHFAFVKAKVESFEERVTVWQGIDEANVGKVCTVSTVLPQQRFLTSVPLSSPILKSCSYTIFSVKR
jgi:serine/threonine protein kinase